MDTRAAKLALARQKLKNHQEKKQVGTTRDEPPDINSEESAQIDMNTINAVAEYDTEANFITQEQDESTGVNIPSPPMEPRYHNADVNVTEILISTKQNLESQVNELQLKLSRLENNYTIVVNNNDYCKQQIVNLEHEIKFIQEKLLKANDENVSKEKIISELNKSKSAYKDENNNLQEQLEFTKSILNEKETENNMLHCQIVNLQNQLDATQLQLQQISNGSPNPAIALKPSDSDESPEVLLKKMSTLEHQLKSFQKEKEQLAAHYEHYLNELNDQLKVTAKRNNDLETELQRLTTRESCLIEQIGDMEIRIQSMKQKPVENITEQAGPDIDDTELHQLKDKCGFLQGQLEMLSKKYEELQMKYAESEAKLQKMSQVPECEHDNLSLSKLTADIASDKVAAQRATEQNKQLKKDLQELEEAFVKISRDKLELTEKVTAEKYLNRELTIKLAEVEEKANGMHTKLLAKDEEMMRLQNSYRELERKISELTVLPTSTNLATNGHNAEHTDCDGHDHSHAAEHADCDGHDHSHAAEHADCDGHDHSHAADDHEQHAEVIHHQCLLNENEDNNGGPNIPKHDAMVKLQDRFLKIMDEVANLSDEKHRLEHIIVQLQTETDTICEYVALYQQQRSLLKKRDEERSAQIKIFQSESDQLKRQLEELSGILIRLAQDPELAVFFQSEPKQSDLAKVLNLLSNLKSNTLIDPCKSSSELKNFYPCSCCSGQLIEV